MSDKHPIRNGVIASVVAGIILGALGQAWPPARRLVSGLWATLSAGVTLPVWAFVLFALAVLGLVLVERLQRRGVVPKASDLMTARPHAASAPVTRGGSTVVARPDRQARSAPPWGDAIDISGLERDVLQRIAKDDGEAVPQDTVKRSLGTTNLRLQTALDHLAALDLVEVLQEVDDEDEIVLLLTPRGRQYVVEKRLA